MLKKLFQLLNIGMQRRSKTTFKFSTTLLIELSKNQFPSSKLLRRSSKFHKLFRRSSKLKTPSESLTKSKSLKRELLSKNKSEKSKELFKCQ